MFGELLRNPINLSVMLFVGRVKPASNAEKYAACTLYALSKIKKFFLVSSAHCFRCGIPAGTHFLERPIIVRKEAAPTSTKAPQLWTIESAAGGIGSFLAPLPKPRPLVPRFGVLQGGA
ncbi:MAG: hypothetical protein RL571_1131 [Pseudomonadota bacterium]|jgi:hypothetical protein